MQTVVKDGCRKERGGGGGGGGVIKLPSAVPMANIGKNTLITFAKATGRTPASARQYIHLEDALQILKYPSLGGIFKGAIL